MIINARNLVTGQVHLEITLDNKARYNFMLQPYKNEFSNEIEHQFGFGIESIIALHEMIDAFLSQRGYK
jgi:hypothetical protein